MDLILEFNRQVQNLVEKKYPDLSNLSEAEFRDLCQPLIKDLEKQNLSPINISTGQVPFVLVVSSDLISSKQQMESLIWNNKPGFEKLFPHLTTDFRPRSDISLPTSSVYLLLGINRGDEFLNIRPEDALKAIQEKGNTPLTMEEGIALVTQFPDLLIKNHCFSLLGSRVEGNQRVPAIWINAQKQANLGWCWDRNPHTWLGSAFANKRVG